MRRWLAKLMLLLPCCLLVLLSAAGTLSVTTAGVAAALAALAATCLWEVLPHRPARVLIAVIWAVLCWMQPLFGLFWPLLLFDALRVQLWPLAALAAASLLATLRGAGTAAGYSGIHWAALAVLCALAVLLWWLNAEATRLQRENRAVRDDAVEANMALERKNAELLAAQEENTKLATLAERSRIAREIHDNVGHMLARGMVQTGALITLNRDETVGDGLGSLKNTLAEAMNSVRSSVHNLHDESLDLYALVRAALAGFERLECNLNYDMPNDAPHAVKTCFLAVLREALANTSRHSDASRVSVSIQEHPAFYQLVVADNGDATRAGALPSGAGGRGMGLENMRQRAEALGGRFAVRQKSGYAIRLTIPRQLKAQKTEDTP